MSASKTFMVLAASVGAGFVGGAVSSSWFAPRLVHAQAIAPHHPIAPPPLLPKGRVEPGSVTGQRFVLTDSNGKVFGVIGLTGDEPEIVLYDASGKVVWKAPGHAGVYPVSAR